MASSSESKRQIVVAAELFNRIYSHEDNKLIGSRSDMREFYSLVGGVNLVT